MRLVCPDDACQSTGMQNQSVHELTSRHQPQYRCHMQTKSALAQTEAGLPAVPPLRAVREAHGLSLRETARRAQIDPAHLSRVERGERQLSVDSLGRLAEVLNLPELARLLAP